MKIAVVGCGGVGGVIASVLTRAGLDVTPVCGNRTIAEALAKNGYQVRDYEGTSWSVPVARAPLIGLGGATEPFDLIFLATQSTTLRAALEGAPLANHSLLVTCQNGLPEELVVDLVGPERVLGCVVGWGASMVEPGRYIRTSRGGLQLGRPFAESPDPLPVASLLEPGFAVSVVPTLAAVRWSKLAINCVTSTLGAVGGAPLGSLLRHRSVRRLALEIITEVFQLSRALGIRLAPVGGTFDIERVTLTDEDRRAPIGSPSLTYKHAILLGVGFKYRRMRSSMLYAIERGRPPEIDHLNGEVVRRGARLGIPTPVNRALCDRVNAICRKELQPSLRTLRALNQELQNGRLAA
jgi:2-dehydropantoate 2-reductase